VCGEVRRQTCYERSVKAPDLNGLFDFMGGLALRALAVEGAIVGGAEATKSDLTRGNVAGVNPAADKGTGSSNFILSTRGLRSSSSPSESL
jgi:hypothetical protein